MKKFVLALALAKLAFLGFITSVACRTTQTAAPLPTPVVLQTVTPSPAASDEDKITRPVSDAYAGDLSIFEGEKRAENLQIERVMDILKIAAGKSVADIGAGSGWFTVRAAKRVGENGKVFAVEINQEYINHINERAKRENLPQIQTVSGTFENPNLLENSTDAVLVLKTYHEIGEPIKVMKNVRKSLKENGLVGIIDRNGTGADHGIGKEKVVAEMKRAGFEKIDDYDFVKADGMDYFLVFKKAK